MICYGINLFIAPSFTIVLEVLYNLSGSGLSTVSILFYEGNHFLPSQFPGEHTAVLPHMVHSTSAICHHCKLSLPIFLLRVGKIGKFNLHNVWDRVLLNMPGLKKGMCKILRMPISPNLTPLYTFSQVL